MSLLTDLKSNWKVLREKLGQEKQIIAINDNRIMTASEPKIGVKENISILHQTGMDNQEIADTLNDLGYKQPKGHNISARFVKVVLEEMTPPKTGNIRQRFRNRNELFKILKAKGLR